MYQRDNVGDIDVMMDLKRGSFTMNKKYLKGYAKQMLLLRDIQKIGYNVVTCGRCGQAIIHKTGKSNLVCHECEFVGDICDFPDIFY